MYCSWWNSFAVLWPCEPLGNVSGIGIFKYVIVEIKFSFCDIKLTGQINKIQPGTTKANTAEHYKVVLVNRTHVGP